MTASATTLALLAVGEALLSALLAGVILAGTSLIGFHLFPGGLRPNRRGLMAPLSLSAGGAVLGVTLWVTGLFLGTAWAWPIFAVFCGVSVRSAAEWTRAWRGFLRGLWLRIKAGRFLASVTGAYLLLLFPLLSTPLCDSDGLRYHVALPKAYALAGKVFLYPWDLCGAFPQGAEMLYLLGYLAGRAEAAKFVHAFFFLGVLANLLLFVHRGKRSRTASWIAVLMFAVSPVAVVCATGGFIDHIALFHLATAAVLIRDRSRPLGPALALGAAAVTKLTAGPATVVLAFWGIARSAPGRRRMAAVALLSVPLLVYAPFGIRNLVALGDPIYPTGYALAGKHPPGLPEGAVGRVTNWTPGITGPLGISWTGLEEGAHPDEVAGIHHIVALFLLAVALRVPEARVPLAIVAVYIAVGLKVRPPARLLMPLFFGLAAVAGIALGRLRRPLGLSLSLLLAAQPAYFSGRILLTQFGSLDYLSGRIPKTDFLARAVPGYRAADFVNRLPFLPGQHVMALDFPAPFLFDHPWIVEGIVHDPPLQDWIRDAATATAVLERLRADVRYLLVTPGYGGGTQVSMLPLARTPEKLPLIAELRARLRRVATVDGVDIYEVPSARANGIVTGR